MLLTPQSKLQTVESINMNLPLRNICQNKYVFTKSSPSDFSFPKLWFLKFSLSVFTSTESSRFSMKQPKRQSAVGCLLVNEERGTH